MSNIKVEEEDGFCLSCGKWVPKHKIRHILSRNVLTPICPFCRDKNGLLIVEDSFEAFLEYLYFEKPTKTKEN